MTPITAWQVVAGKLFSRLLVALTLIGLSLPALALVRLLGGVELSQMTGIVCVCAAMALTSAAIGLLLSTFMNRAYAVILLSYAAMLFLYAFLPFVFVMAVGMRTMAWFWILSATNPFVCAGAIAEPRFFMMAGTNWSSCVLLHLAFTAVLVMASAAAVRRVSRKAGGEAVSAEPAARVDVAATTAPLPAEGMAGETPAQSQAPAPLPYHTRREVRRGRDVSDRPVLWRELRRPLLPKRWQAVVAGVAALAMLFVTYAVVYSNDLLNQRGTQVGYAYVFNLLLWLLTAVLAATAIAQEKEGDTWTLLLTTPLGGRAVVWGKVFGLYRRLLWPTALFAAHMLLFAVADVIDLPAAFLVIWVMFSFNSIWVATGLYLSLRLNKVTFAVIANLILAVGMYIGVPAVCFVIGELVSFHDLQKQVGWYMPYMYLVECVYDRPRQWNNGMIRMPGEVMMTYGEFAFTAVAVGVAHLVAACGILAATAGTFDRIVGRARQTGRSSGPAARLGGARPLFNPAG
jgi:ABC-type transport system involved in multi-copper enzyme maturation permease subunit